MRKPVSLGQVSRKLRPAPPPLEANDQLVTAVITAAWAVGLVSVLVLRDDLSPADRWCAVGLCLGLFGLWYVPRLKRARARQAQRRAQARAEAETEARAD
jgi:type VI protein secretion system component VasK